LHGRTYPPTKKGEMFTRQKKPKKQLLHVSLKKKEKKTAAERAKVDAGKDGM